MILGTSSYASVELGGITKETRLFSLNDGVVNTDTIVKSTYKSFAESITSSDTFSILKAIFLILTETVQNTDILIKGIYRNFTESIQNTDILIKTTIKNFTEAITNSDTFTTLKAIFITLTESVKSTASLWINGQFIDAWWTKRVKPIIMWTKRTIGSVVWTKRNKPQ
jgi:hypothetical protein